MTKTFKFLLISFSVLSVLFTPSASALTPEPGYDVAKEDTCGMAFKYSKEYTKTIAGTDYQFNIKPHEFRVTPESYANFDLGSLPLFGSFGLKAVGEFNQQIWPVAISYQCYENLDDHDYNGFSNSFISSKQNYNGFINPERIEDLTHPSKSEFCNYINLAAESCDLISNQARIIKGGGVYEEYYYFAKGDLYYFFRADSQLLDEINAKLQFPEVAEITPSKDFSLYCSDFSDVDSRNDFMNFICTLKLNNIIGGYSDGTYKPTRNVTRGEMAVFIKRAFNIETNTSCGDFSDMNASTPFYEEATSLKCAGIIGGSDDGKGGKRYLWQDNVTRGEMAVFILKAANKTGENIAINTTCENFNDMNASTPFYEEATSLKCAGIIGGYQSNDGGRDYRFSNDVNRAELSVFVVRGQEAVI